MDEFRTVYHVTIFLKVDDGAYRSSGPPAVFYESPPIPRIGDLVTCHRGEDGIDEIIAKVEGVYLDYHGYDPKGQQLEERQPLIVIEVDAAPLEGRTDDETT